MDYDPAPAPPAASPAVDELMPLVYDELRRLAGRVLAGEARQVTLQPTSLVHEAYLRLAEQRRARWQDKSHFFRVAAQMMRRVLIDHYRARQSQKRGGDEIRVTLVDAPAGEPPPAVDLIALDRALEALERLDPQQARIVELRFFAGLTVEETAAALAVSTATVKREWAMARAWLSVELAGDPPSHGR